MSDRQYELVYLLPPDTTEQQVADLHTQVEQVVSKMNGQIEKNENWGRRRLAYEIGHHKEAVYVLDVINERQIERLHFYLGKVADEGGTAARQDHRIVSGIRNGDIRQ